MKATYSVTDLVLSVYIIISCVTQCVHFYGNWYLALQAACVTAPVTKCHGDIYNLLCTGPGMGCVGGHHECTHHKESILV